MNFLCTYNCSFLYLERFLEVPPPSFASVAATFPKAGSSKKAGGMIE